MSGAMVPMHSPGSVLCMLWASRSPIQKDPRRQRQHEVTELETEVNGTSKTQQATTPPTVTTTPIIVPVYNNIDANTLTSPPISKGSTVFSPCTCTKPF